MPLLARISLALLSGACAASIGRSADPAPRGSQPQIGTDQAILQLYPHGKRAKDVIGMDVRGQTGEPFGKVGDLVIDTRSGRILYAIVGSGGFMGVGDRRHAVPFEALSFSPEGRQSLVLNLPASEWRTAPAFSEGQLAALSDAEKSAYIYRHYHLEVPHGADTGDASATPSERASRYRLATTLFGRDIVSGAQEVGTAEDLVVHLDAKRASVLMDPDDQFAGSPDRYVVPFNHLSVSAETPDTLATRLQRSDFEGARPAAENREAPSEGIYRWRVGDR